jgi:hypothetical protein
MSGENISAELRQLQPGEAPAPATQDIERNASSARVASSPASDTQVILQVIDAPFTGEPPNLLLQSYARHNPLDALNTLPPHGDGIARIYDFTVDKNRSPNWHHRFKAVSEPYQMELIHYLMETYNMNWMDHRQIFKWPSDQSPALDIGCIGAQWSQSISEPQQLSQVSVRTSLKETPTARQLSVENSHLICLRDGERRLVGRYHDPTINAHLQLTNSSDPHQ